MTDLNLCPKSAWLPANIDACGLYRMFIPHLNLKDSLFLFKDRLDLKLIADYEVVIVQRQVTPENLKALQMLKKAGKKIVYDLDDNMWALPASNPAQKAFQAMVGGFTICAKEADVLTVSTVGLKSAVKSAMPQLKCEILVTPNAMDFNLFSPSKMNRNDGRILLGWAGSNTHAGDLREINGVLPDLINKHENLHVEFVGMKFPDGLQNHPRVHSKSWVPVGEFASRFSNWCWDICIAPLEDIRFNRSKSSIKMLECAAMHIPCLVSDVQPYREFCALGGKELEWLLCSFKTDWQKKLERLINDPLYRNYLGDLMYATARKYFDIKTVKDNWIYALKFACGEKATNG